MEEGTWVRVVTYDYVFGIPSWAERDRSVVGDPTGYHEFTAPPRTILHLAPEVAADLLLKPRAVHLPGERLPYIPMLERRKHERVPNPVPSRRRPRDEWAPDVRVIKLRA